MQKALYFTVSLLIHITNCYSQCINSGFESTAPGTYTAANAVSGWSISSQTIGSCATSTSWTPGSSEFSIVATPLLNYPVIGNIPNSPLGGSHVAILNDFTPNMHSTRITQTLSVTNFNSVFKFAYAGIFQDGGHNCCEQPKFRIEISDCSNVSVFGCSNFTVNSASSLCTTSSASLFPNSNGITWTNWKVETVDLNLYIGSCVSISLIVSDCVFGGHYGSILLDAVCGAGLTMLNPNPYQFLGGWVNYCAGSNQAVLNATPNFASYQWFAPATPSSPAMAISQATTSSLVVINPVIFPPVYIYTCQLTTIAGCVFTATYVIAQTQVSLNAIGSDPSCLLGSSGTASVFVSGSGTGYNYTWLNSTNSVVGTSSVLSNVPPGPYTVSVTALNTSGCGSDAATVTVGSAVPPVQTLLKPYCTDAYFITPGGTNFQWYNNLSPVSPPLGTTASYTNTAPCNGCVTWLSYTNLQGCHDSIQYVMVASLPGSLSISSSASVCPGPGQGTATINLTPVNSSLGMNTFSVYSVNSSQVTYSVFSNLTPSNTYTLANLPGNTTYSINAFDGSCNYSSSFFIGHLIPPFDFSLSLSSTTLCNSSSANASVHFTNQASPSEYNYSWSPNLFIGGSVTSQSVTISPSFSAGTFTLLTYSVMVTPTLVNCPLTKTLSVMSVNLPTPVISPVPALCRTALPLHVQVNPIGGIFIDGSSNQYIGITGLINPALALIGNTTFTYLLSQSNCSTSASGSFSVNPSPTLNVIQVSTICEGEEITLTVSGADTYSWSEGSTTQSITITPYGTSYYTVLGTNSTTSCFSTEQIVVYTYDCVGIAENKNSSEDFVIYPNPTAGRLYFETQNEIKLFMCDYLGKTLLEKIFQKGTHDIDLANYTNGIYILKIVYKNETKVKKLVKNN